MTHVRTKAKPIAIDIVIRNFIEEIILLTFLIKDQIDSSSLVTWLLLLLQMIWVILEMFHLHSTTPANYTIQAHFAGVPGALYHQYSRVVQFTVP
jgi:hypothetical protein